MNKPLLKLLLLTFFIFLFPLVMQINFAEHVREGEFNTRFGWPLIILMLAMLHKNTWLYRLSVIPFMITATADISYAYLFGGVFTTATIEAVMQTDIKEFSEFFEFYFSLPLLLILTFYWSVCLSLMYKLDLNLYQSKAYKTIFYLGAFMAVVVTYRVAIMNKYYDTIPGVMGSVPSYAASSVSIESEKELRAKLVQTRTINDVLNKDEAMTLVFVIGESLNRNHMSIYGYHRDTTPSIEKHASQLVVFNDVISSHAQTRKSLSHALSEATLDNKKSHRESLSILDVANQAGFKTWWISNQQPLRHFFSAVADQADITQFISNDYSGVENERYDGFMLPYVQEAIEDKTERKAIFIHMMGSHAQYRNRYPERFELFEDRNVRGYKPDLSVSQIDKINSYDNSVLYTDHVVGNIIELLKSTEKKSSLVMLSDHGEEIFGHKNISGHGPDNVTAGMLEIPFLLWMSKDQLNSNLHHRIQLNTDAPFRLDDFFIAAVDLMGVRDQQFDFEKSFFSLGHSNIQKAPRVVYKKQYETEIRQSQKFEQNIANCDSRSC